MKSKLLIYLSLIILAIGLVGIYITQKSQLVTVNQSAPESSSVSQAETQVLPAKTFKIWQAKDDIARGQQVSRSDFKIVQILESEAFDMGIQSDVELKFSDVLVSKSDLAKDVAVFQDYFITPDEDGYFRYIMEDGYLPVPISVKANSVMGDVIQAGSIVDILALTSTNQNLSGNSQVKDLSRVSLTTILSAVKVLQVFKDTAIEENIDGNGGNLSVASVNDVPMILQLTKEQAVKISLAQGISQLEVLISSNQDKGKYIDVDLGDIVPDFKPVRELRAEN